MICCCPDAEGSLQTGVGRNISGSLCGITKWFLEIQGRLKTENSARATIGLPNKRVAYGGSFLLKGSVLFAECDLECGAAPRCCQHWHRLFAILFDPAHPIGVYFETENIYTLNPSSQYSLDIQALLADWESGNKSRRMILSYDQRIMTGQYPVADLMGYEQIEGRSIDLKCRLYRSKWIQSIAASDVMKFGQVVENPMIGAIPSRNEVQRELDDLLMSM